MFKLEGIPLPLDTPFTAGDVQYPANWLRLSSAEEKAAIGITEEADPESYDDRFYWGVSIPKDLDQLKSDWVKSIKETAGKLLSQTDWYVWRNFERQIAIPETVVTKRAIIVAESNRLELEINSCTTVEELIIVLSLQNWVKDDE